MRELIPVIVKIKPAHLQQNLCTKCHHAPIAKFACGYISVVFYSQKLKKWLPVLILYTSLLFNPFDIKQ